MKKAMQWAVDNPKKAAAILLAGAGIMSTAGIGFLSEDQRLEIIDKIMMALAALG